MGYDGGRSTLYHRDELTRGFDSPPTVKVSSVPTTRGANYPTVVGTRPETMVSIPEREGTGVKDSFSLVRSEYV